MLIRQRVLVTMLQSAGGTVSKLQLMKWAFLLSHETQSRGGDNFYRFVPYHYGPYSFSLQQEMECLIRDGLVQGSNNIAWKLTLAGQETLLVVPVEISRDVRSILNKYGQQSVSELIDSIYSRYPWFTINSTRMWRRQQARPQARLAIYTIGYEGLLVDAFLNEILVQGLEAILDVRNNPVSRRYGFHKNTLARLCQAVGLKYYHFPELGIPTESRQELHSQAHYNSLFASYEHGVLTRERGSVEAVSKIMTTAPAVLVCMEANPNYCHRSRLANTLGSLTSLSIMHLGWPR